MRKTHQPYGSVQDLTCRRRTTRIPMPVEVCFTANGSEVAAIIRDVSYDASAASEVMGIGVLHHEPLPLDELLLCRADSAGTVIPRTSEVILLWTRHFGNQGYLSGGRMFERTADTVDDTRSSDPV